MANSRLSSLPAHARRLLFVATIPCCSLVHAESWIIRPEVSLSETYSTNMTLSTNAVLEGWISDIAPSLHIAGAGSRLKANLDYRLDSTHYTGHPELQQNQNFLNSNATLEAVDKWLYIDAGASIVQRKIAAFGPSASDSGSANGNRSETRTLQLSPYVKGQVSDLAVYQLRANAIDSSANDASLAHTRVGQMSGSVRNVSAGAKVGLFADGELSIIDNSVIGKHYDARTSAGLDFALFPQLHFSVLDGVERTNYASYRQTDTTPGVGVVWSPSPRSQFAAVAEKRFFGTSHNLLLNHRTAWTNWRYSDIKDVTDLPSLLAGSGQGVISELMSGLLTASIPDPLARAEAVRARLDGGPDSQSGGGAIQTSRLFINHARTASAAVIGSRDTLTLSLTQLEQQALGDGSGAADSFALSSNIRQQGAVLSLAHRVTPLTTLTVATSRQHIVGASAANLNSTQLSHNGALSFHVAPQTYVSVGGKIVRFSSAIDGHANEYAVGATLMQRF